MLELSSIKLDFQFRVTRKAAHCITGKDITQNSLGGLCYDSALTKCHISNEGNDR